jgi:hypothetical protein
MEKIAKIWLFRKIEYEYRSWLVGERLHRVVLIGADEVIVACMSCNMCHFFTAFSKIMFPEHIFLFTKLLILVYLIFGHSSLFELINK